MSGSVRTKNIRKRVFHRDDYRCYLCGRKVIIGTEKRRALNPSLLFATVDHVVPKAKGGLDTFNNLRTCCHICNNKKGNMGLIEYAVWLIRKVDYAPFV